MQKTVLRLSGLDCLDCARKLEKAISEYPGVLFAQLNFNVGKVVIEHKVSEHELIKLIKSMGYGVVPQKNNDSKTAASRWYEDNRLILTIVSGIFFLFAVVVQFALKLEALSIYLFSAAIILGGFYIFRNALNSLKSFNLDMNVLMTIAVFGAAAIGEWVEGAAVVLLFSIGNTLQSRTLEKTRGSISQLMELAPEQAVIIEDGREKTVPVAEIEPGHVVIVRPGDKIPVDGTIIKGSTSIDQSPITGESLPVEKSVGYQVFAGTINIDGYLEIRTEKRSRESTLARIIHLVEEAQNEKAPVQQLVDRFANYYTPVVIMGAVLLTIIPTWILGLPFEQWFYSSLVLLVIACPCALVISTPVSLVAAIGNAARNGILIKGGSYLELAGTLKAVAFDKTGTLTKGCPRVKSIHILSGNLEEHLLTTAASLEKMTKHPLAQALVREAENRGLELHGVSNFKQHTGKGISGDIGANTYYAGSMKLFKEIMDQDKYLEYSRIIEDKVKEKSIVIIGSSTHIEGIITFEDSIREEARDTVRQLKELGLNKVVMLTGDNEQAAQKAAHDMGIDYEADLLPQEKLDYIRKMKALGKVAMVGDGVNDAPALAAADIGIAMGTIGTDTAIETADIALMADDISRVPYVVKLSKRTVRVIKENIIFSLAIKAVFIALALTGNATLWMAIFADTGAALLVIINGMRLMKN
ncbi:heavy metal translocating P-type ATPase [Desulfitibacter alkalitolerans]|uniref:heavy metal translocating P-type ATPase n=1 Tax=Desulfitibacter alkalitolerans TaxID=264641 RepID=UPI00146FB524|nr:cation-translocating P-type ATPase [Desulfitibacter alkalitolerans]